MSFEDTLRSEIQREAGAVPLPDRSPERATERARQRRNHKRVAVATVAAATVVAVAVSPALSGDGPAADVQVQSASQGIPATGPLDMAWQHTPGGLSNVMPVVQDGGVVYALSSGPGTRMADYTMGDYPVALYKLADDGTWEPIELDGPRVKDVAAADGLLYSIATAPGDGGAIGLQLATSEDGGATWAPQDVALPDPPSDAVEWTSDTKLALESDGDTTLAVAVTGFTPDYASVFPQMADDPTLFVEPRDDGVALLKPDLTAVDQRTAELGSAIDQAAGADGAAGAPTTTAPAPPPTAGPTTTVPAPAATAAPTTTAPDTIDPLMAATAAPTTTATAGPTTTATTGPSTTTTVAPPTTAGPTTTATVPATTAPPSTTTTTGPAGPADPADPPTTAPTVDIPSEVVDTATWDELGLDGPEGLDPVYQVLRRDDDGWAAVEGAGEDFAGLSGLELDTAEGRFVASAWDGGDQVVLTSDDGADWARVAGPGDGTILGMGAALVELPWDGSTGHVSTDGGATWEELDFAGSGLGASNTYAADAGPLGLALVLNDPGGLVPTKIAVTGDLVDWTVTPLADVVGPDPVGMASVFVGEDRVVLTAVDPPTGTEEPPASRTAVGVPHRD